MTESSKSWQLSFVGAVAIWAVIVAMAAFWGILAGLTGARFVVALGVAATLFAFEFFLAVPRALDRMLLLLGSRGGVVAPLVPLFAVLIYSLGVTNDWKLMLAGAAYTVVPALLVASNAGKPLGTWEDYAAALLLWLPVELKWMSWVFPEPPQLTHTLTVLMALSAGVAAFVLLRRLDGVGYAAEWKHGFGWNFALHYLLFAAIAIAIGIRIGFLKYSPALPRLHELPFSTIGTFPIWALGVLFFTAWPEEFFFRGLLQNLLSRTFKNAWAGLAVASVIFGLSHVFHAPYPNWKYVGLATIAGFFYGHAWMKSGSLVPSVLIHALVDLSWHVLFR